MASTTRPTERVLALALWAASACARVAPAVPFLKSAAYHGISGSVVGVLERDFGDDGRLEAVVVRRDPAGFVLQVLGQAPGTAEGWTALCAGPVVPGEDLLQLAALGSPTEVWVALTTDAANPEETLQLLQVLDPRGCAPRHGERVRVQRPEGGLLGPQGAPALGVTVEAGAVRIVDRPRYVQLTGPQDPAAYLARYRRRIGTVGPAGLNWQETEVSVLERTPVEALWRLDGEEGAATTRLGGDGATELTIAAAGTLVLDAPRPLVLLELHHGCAAEDAPLILRQGAQTYAAGSRPAAGGFIRAAGRRRTDATEGAQELLGLAAPATHLELGIDPADRPQCLRELIGYAWSS
jgi:hypothetical protein